MIAVSARRTLLPLSLVVALPAAAHAQATVPARAPAPAGATAAWTLKLKGDIRWQQVTPAGALLVSTDDALSGVDIERGVVAWEKPELSGLPADSVRIVEGSLLMEARSEEHTSELQSLAYLVCRLLLEKKKKI